MDANTVEHRLDAEGADQQMLAGINDANLQELAKASGCRVILRGDHLILSGEVNEVARTVPDFDADDVRREYVMISQRTPRKRDDGSSASVRTDEGEQVVLAGLR